MKSVKNQVNGRAKNQVWGRVYDQVWSQVLSQVREQVWHEVGVRVTLHACRRVRGDVSDQICDEITPKNWRFFQ